MPEVFPSTARLMLARVARVQQSARVPSLVAAVFRGGHIVWSAGRGDVPGMADGGNPLDVQYRLGSITKTITAIAVMRLRDEGRLDLADPLERHLPGTPLGDRTIAALLGHLGGVTSEAPGDWWERTPGTTLGGLGLTPSSAVLAVGRRFHYSNLGFALLGEAVSRTRGRPWADVVTDEVLRPLGMTRTTTRPEAPAATGFAVHPWADVVQHEPEHDAGVMAPAGQLWSTANDLARLGACLLGATDGVLDAGTVEEMMTPATTNGPQSSSYGLAVDVLRCDDVTMVGHGGSMPGFLAGFLVDPAERTGALVLANTTYGLDVSIVQGLLADLRGAEPRVVDAWKPAPSSVPLDHLGHWYWGPMPFVLRSCDGALQLDAPTDTGLGSRFRRHPLQPGAWIALDGYFAGETMRVVPHPTAADGAPVALNISTFVLSRLPYDPSAPIPGGLDPGGWQPA